MAFTFPLTLAQFFQGLPIQSAVADLGEAMEYSETGAGEILVADIGTRLWTLDVNIRLGSYAEIARIKAKLDMLRQAGRSLIVHSFPLIAPQYDPTGAVLGASSVSLTTVASNNRDINLSGLPAGYVLQEGDFLSFQYGSNPIRYALHQAVVARTASGGGVITALEVIPFVRPGWTAGAAVKLIRPEMKAIIVPGSTKAPRSGAQISEGLSFQLTQTFR